MKKLIILLLCAFFVVSNTDAAIKPKPKKGYNYSAHKKKCAKYKKNNEASKYMKCNRKH